MINIIPSTIFDGFSLVLLYEEIGNRKHQVTRAEEKPKDGKLSTLLYIL